MSQPEEGWRVAIGPTEWVTVSTPGEAVALGRHLATLVAAIGVEKVERERLAAENERLRKAGDEMADTRNKPTTLSEFGHLAMALFAAKEGRDAK